MKIAVLGSGNGGCAVAFDCAASGHHVSLFDFEQFPDSIRSVHDKGGIHSVGQLEGFQSVPSAGHDIAEALDQADIIYAAGPAYSTRPFAEACRPHLKKGQIVIVCPGSCGGAAEFKIGIDRHFRDEEILVSETSTLPYAVRLVGPGKIRVFLKLKAGIFLAALPAKHTDFIIEKIKDVYPAIRAAKNVLQTSLQNGNPVIHPAITLLNAGLIERTGGDFYFYQEGVTRAAGRLIKAVDEERIAIGKKLNVEVLSEPVLGTKQGYMAEPTYDIGYSKAPGFKGIKAPPSLDDRYLNEDVGYGLVFMKSLADQFHIDTPAIDTVIGLASILMSRDYQSEGKRTMISLGLSEYNAEELESLIT